MSSPLLESTVVVTVSYNSSAQLAVFLDSVAGSEADPVSIVIADNRSGDLDRTRSIAAARGARVLELPDNRGYGGAINAAVATLPSPIEYILISNPDVEVGAGAISLLLDELAGDPRIGAIGPRVLNVDGTTYPSARKLPSLRTGIGHALFAHLWPGNPWTRAYRAEHEGADVRRSVGWLSGSCLLVRREAFEQLSGFDEGFFMYFEDVDLGYRLGKAGWSNVYFPRAAVTHTGAVSTSAESEKMIRVHHESALRFLEKKYSAAHLAPIRWALRVALSVRARVFMMNDRRR
ncbi:glycosyltransferase family 2 protein [Cryobacterium melibiosiphilum]|uniref:Glycosyltransferase family 2 protein n=1 Tax=Cryobacterium melibiosiphilum TaxID=995039 RepID=A0A3A5MLR7_9MICO|nr:glycosyltransferase family 2 protein [Cryobacterium melibiosiphilum]RJT87793.1 glycosyltransferase family 2 protein [Cryobacterium melibiosiphilum]